MGQVRTQLTIVNRADEILASAGSITTEQIRKTTLEVLADTGAMLLSLPTHVIEQLGLSQLKEVMASTAAGYQRTRVFQDAKVSIGDRVGVFQCLELRGGDNPLLGVIPMEELGLELDLQKQELRMLPMVPGNSYLLAYGHTLHNLDGSPLSESK